ncbi:hypothetical protein PLICRDRAFT_38498 [Plicaturopsis crispa FD-325 SS-3]|nr:hypothetical protein PLICRDRAFT_38498 [Plicaturopsis crispa FD-325 SS-3]
MKAARYYGPGDIRVEQVAEPTPKNGQVKIKVRRYVVCGSDLHAYLARISLYATEDVPNSITGEVLPITLGHEFSGTITEVGEDVDSKLTAGQNVVVEPLISCMKTSTCRSCASGSRNVCPDINFYGIGGNGGMANFIVVDQFYVHVLPDNVPLDIGALVEPLSVAWHGVKRSGFKEGDTALVLGAGPIGILVLKVLLGLKASKIIVSEPSTARGALALKIGATQVINPLKADLAAVAHSLTDGAGVDVAYDCVGIQSSIDAGIASVRPRGTVVNLALWEKNPVIDMNLLLMKEIILTGIIGYDRVHEDVIHAIASGQLSNLEDLITSKIAIEDVVEEGFKKLIREKDTQIKILVHP